MIKVITHKKKNYNFDTDQKPLYFQSHGYKYKVVADDGEIKYLTEIQVGLSKSKRRVEACYDTECTDRKRCRDDKEDL
jgi:hypothetical protein